MLKSEISAVMRKMGRRGGKARAKKMSAAERSESARKAALAKHAKRKALAGSA